MTAAPPNDRWLVALDVDGTILHEDGALSPEVAKQIGRVAAIGHEVTIATGRSVAMTLSILGRVGIAPEFAVCANGAITLRREPAGSAVDTAAGNAAASHVPANYVRDRVETFDPAEVITTIRGHLASARFAVEDESGEFLYAGGALAEWARVDDGRAVEFEELLVARATRVVVISPEHAVEDFLKIVERMGLRRVSYNVGWTAWLDIAPDGVNKAVALESVRQRLKIPRSRVMAVGDGRNDIEMLEWAAASGRGVAMGQAPPEVLAVASEVTGTDVADGVATLLAGFGG